MQNNNNFYNPYGNPYMNNYRANYTYPQNNVFQQSQIQQPQNNIPMAAFYVQGIEGAKAFFVQPNQTVFLRDSEANILYEKSADFQGKTTMKVYDLVEKNENDPSNQFISRNEFDETIKKIYKKLGGKYESNTNVKSDANDGQ